MAKNYTFTKIQLILVRDAWKNMFFYQFKLINFITKSMIRKDVEQSYRFVKNAWKQNYIYMKKVLFK